MSISLAIDNVVSTLTSLATISEENQEPGSVDYHLGISIGEQDPDYFFGASRTRQEIILTLTVNSLSITDGDIAEKQKEIHDALVVDRRRDGNAQTTAIGPWEKNEDEGREGKVFESTIEIFFNE